MCPLRKLKRETTLPAAVVVDDQRVRAPAALCASKQGVVCCLGVLFLDAIGVASRGGSIGSAEASTAPRAALAAERVPATLLRVVSALLANGATDAIEQHRDKQRSNGGPSETHRVAANCGTAASNLECIAALYDKGAEKAVSKLITATEILRYSRQER